MEKAWVLDFQKNKATPEAQAEIRELWADNELGNDTYYHSTTLEELREEGEYPAIIAYLETQAELKEDDTIMLHWWW